MKTDQKYKYKGKLLTIKEIHTASRTTMSYKKFYQRIVRSKMSVKRALSPVNRPSKYQLDGENVNLVQLAEENGLKVGTLRLRLNNKQPLKKALMKVDKFRGEKVLHRGEWMTLRQIYELEPREISLLKFLGRLKLNGLSIAIALAIKGNIPKKFKYNGKWVSLKQIYALKGIKMPFLEWQDRNLIDLIDEQNS